MDRLKNSLRKFSVPAAGTVNTDLTQTEPPCDPRFYPHDPKDYPPEADSGISVVGRAPSKIAIKRQKELAETVAPCPQIGFPLKPLTKNGRKII